MFILSRHINAAIARMVVAIKEIERQKKRETENEENPSPECDRHANGECGLGIGFTGKAHAEGIASCTEVRIVYSILCTQGLPCLLFALEHILIAGTTGVGVAQVRETDGEGMIDTFVACDKDRMGVGQQIDGVRLEVDQSALPSVARCASCATKDVATENT